MRRLAKEIRMLRCLKFAVRPRLETLEDRCCPSSVINRIGNQLFITGDALGDHVEIADDGAQGVRVSLDGGDSASFSGIAEIKANLGGGENSVVYRPTMLDTVWKRFEWKLMSYIDGTVDSFFIDVTGVVNPSGGERPPKIDVISFGAEYIHFDCVLQPVNLTIPMNVTTGRGNDSLKFTLKGPLGDPAPPAAVAPQLFNISTGAGNDSVVVEYAPGDQHAPMALDQLWSVRTG